MQVFRALSHFLIKSFARKDHKFYTQNLNNVQSVQTDILSQLLTNLKDYRPELRDVNNYQDFRRLPLTTYEDYRDDIARLKHSGMDKFCPQHKYFQATSGSSSQVKWIPYNKPFTRQMDKAANIWMYELYKEYPDLKYGHHYWSMSWVPNEFRGLVDTDDSKFFNPIKQWLLKLIFPVPDSVSRTETIEESLYQTAKHLVDSPQLRLISVWSPTFLKSIMDVILEQKDRLMHELKSPVQKVLLLKTNTHHDIKKLWPNLSLVSAWDTASSKQYADKIREYYDEIPFQGKGLWATEGVVSIPYKRHHALAYTSHFYEFEVQKNGDILPAWLLKKGDIVSPILTTPNGFLRYKMNDLLEVTGHFMDCPHFFFIGRSDSVDMVGEKIASHDCQKIIEAHGGVAFVAVRNALSDKKPYYALLAHKNETINEVLVEQELNKNYHYELAREAHQLDAIKVFNYVDPVEIYQKICMQKGMIQGNIKLEYLTSTDSDQLLYDSV
jgi:hypothetical protein